MFENQLENLSAVKADELLRANEDKISAVNLVTVCNKYSAENNRHAAFSLLIDFPAYLEECIGVPLDSTEGKENLMVMHRIFLEKEDYDHDYIVCSQLVEMFLEDNDHEGALQVIGELFVQLLDSNANLSTSVLLLAKRGVQTSLYLLENRNILNENTVNNIAASGLMSNN